VTAFRASYYKMLQNSDGHTFKCLERTVDIDAQNPVAALASIENHGFSLEECDCVEVVRLGDECHRKTST
jgi:hypothetical protein